MEQGTDTGRMSFFHEFRCAAGQETVDEIRGYLVTDKGIEEYGVEMDDNGCIIVKIILKEFSYQGAKSSFLNLAEYMRRSYYNVYAGEEVGEQVRYLFCTGIAGRDGIKMEVVIK